MRRALGRWWSLVPGYKIIFMYSPAPEYQMTPGYLSFMIAYLRSSAFCLPSQRSRREMSLHSGAQLPKKQQLIVYCPYSAAMLSTRWPDTVDVWADTHTRIHSLLLMDISSLNSEAGITIKLPPVEYWERARFVYFPLEKARMLESLHSVLIFLSCFALVCCLSFHASPFWLLLCERFTAQRKYLLLKDCT